MGNKKHTKQQLAIIRRNYAQKAAEENAVSVDMRLAKIRNDYMFTSGNPSGEHTYAVYTENEEVRAIPTTHLYIPDKERMEKLHKGLLRKVKFAGYETPSAVGNQFYNTNAQGGKIDLQDKRIQVDKTPLPQKQAQAIKAFAKYPRKQS